MNQKGNHGGRPVENEYRSSQMYRTLNGINLPGADKLAEGLGKAAAGIDAALHTVNAAAQNYQQNSQPPQTQQTYRYRYPQPGQPPRPPQPGPARPPSLPGRPSRALGSVRAARPTPGPGPSPTGPPWGSRRLLPPKCPP